MKKSNLLIYFGMMLIILILPLFTLAQQTPPTDLSGNVVDANDVQLSWTAPDLGDPLYLHWDDGENADSWGFLLFGEVFDIAAKWDPVHIDAYDGWEITKIRFFITHPSPTLTIKIWEGTAPTEVYSQPVASFTEDAWTEIDLSNPVTIDASTELWAGLNIDMPVGAACVGTDDGPAIDEYGNLYRYQGTWYSDYNNNNLQIYVAPPGAPRGTAELLGYNVYRDDVQVNENTVPATSYLDQNLFNGIYDYYVTALYNDGESDSSNHIQITVEQPVILESDSLALVDLYNNCNGENWDINDNWLVTMVSEWSGVVTKGERVRNLSLLYNDLVGDIPESFGDLTRLRTLHLSGNEIESLPSTFGNLESLNEFWITNTLLTSIPESFGDLDSLETLSLSDNEGLTSLPESFGDLEMLYWFGMGRCNLTGLPTTFGNLDNLYQCYIDYNQITALPESFGDLENLAYLGVNNNLLTALPESFGNLPSLRDLYADENMITELPVNFGNISTLEKLVLALNGMTALPDNFGNLESLEHLRLSVNSLSELPASFHNLTSLNEFYIDQNQLSALPENFGDLQGLYDVSLTANNLTALPESIGELDSLLQMFVVDNDLASLPESIGDLDNIWVLGLGGNAIKGVPESIGNLSSLGYLDLSENEISVLPESMGDLNADTVLLFTNHISEIPETMFDNSYQYLWIDDNRLQFGSIEPFVGNVSKDYAYSPQDNFGPDTTLYPASGTDFEFTLEVTGEHNVYQWYKEGNILDGQTTNTLTLTDIGYEDEGVYNLEVTNTLATDLTLMSNDVIINAIITGIDETSLNELNVYPNPVSGSNINIYTGSKEITSIQILNTAGVVVNEYILTGLTAQIDISELPKGLYLIKASNIQNTQSVIKFIKN